MMAANTFAAIAFYDFFYGSIEIIIIIV